MKESGKFKENVNKDDEIQDEKAITQEALEQFYEKLGFEEELRDSGGVFYKYE